jgi:hypothetical protein
MDKVEFQTIESVDGSLVEYAIIDHGNQQFTSMTKAHYDELKANEAETI